MKNKYCTMIVALGVFLLAMFTGEVMAAAKFTVLPSEVLLQGNFAQAQLIVTATNSGEIQIDSADLTHTAKYTSSNVEVVSVDQTGLLLAVANGTAEIQIRVGRGKRIVTVSVSDIIESPELDFHYSVQPVLSKAGCNMGACHASQHGKGGFVLSVFGYDPSKDFSSIVKDQLQRRVDYIRPENSLFVLKPTAQLPHGGGKRIQVGSVMHDTLVQWVSGGAQGPAKDSPEVVDLVATPGRRVAEVGSTQQLQITATYSDGATRDVTALARYDSLDDGLLKVSTAGLIETLGRGQAGVMVRFEGQATTVMVTIPYSADVDLDEWSQDNIVDKFAGDKFRELGIQPSLLCDDSTFIRRAYLDAIGGLPTPVETQRFLDLDDPDKRTKLIDQLLGLTGDPGQDVFNDRFAAYWTLKWSDLIRNSSATLGEQGMWSLHNWIRESFRVNRGFDEFVKDLIQARGSLYMNGPANYYQINKNSSDLTEATTQLFMGIRLECAKCHHHPFESYSQADYYGMAAFFSRVGTKNSEEFGLFGQERVVVVNPTGDVRHPRTGETMKPTVLHGDVIEHSLDRRIPLASWLTSTQNKWFAKSVVNRYVRYLMGRALVEPVDDMRSTNPASNEAMLTALATSFEESGYDLKQLIRLIMTSRTYQLGSEPTELNASAGKYYAFYHAKRMPAESMLDAINTATGTATKFKDLPPGTLAIELPDTNYPNYFLKTFGKPLRVSVCECERAPDENLAQALHTLNGDTIAKKISDPQSHLGKLLTAEAPIEEIVSHIFMATLSRAATPDEQLLCKQIVSEAPTMKEGCEDILWALINSKQFVYIQ
tara:strand:+ start:1420 stop:3894 length:2475 start_codon:yes stop_codon:yes gene_type:complete